MGNGIVPYGNDGERRGNTTQQADVGLIVFDSLMTCTHTSTLTHSLTQHLIPPPPHDQET